MNVPLHKETVRKVARLEALHINATKTCNLACTFCYDNAQRAKSKNLPLSVYEGIVDDACSLGLQKVILSGGEPLTRGDWRDIALLFAARGVEISLATNGTLITQDVADFMAGLEHYSISISLDGAEQAHDRIRGRKGAYAKTLNGLRILKKAGVKFAINTTLSRDNVGDVKDLARIARDFQCYVRLSLLHPNGRAENMGSQALDAEEIFRVREFCHLLYKSSGVNIHINLPPLLQYLDEIMPTRGSACGWAKHYCGLLDNGDVTICGVASGEKDLIAGNVLHDSLDHIWRNAPLFQKTRNFENRDIKGICGRCPFNDFCGGACRLSAYREAGDFLAPYFLCQRFYDLGHIPEALLD